MSDTWRYSTDGQITVRMRIVEVVKGNSLERQQHWQKELNEHAQVCEDCAHDQEDCDIWVDLISAYNSAREID